ncbi:MAG: tetratricopeptide repeat protein, partial [Hydrococcus sp. RM1_1_31]|nr:tetratricopeptide repeat protein [Hydrococcus sp. RM1_1_31]
PALLAARTTAPRVSGPALRGGLGRAVARHHHVDVVPRQAVADFTRAIELDRDRAETYNYRGTSYFWLKQFQKALADYDRALELDPNLTLAYYNRGYVRIELGDKAGAIEDFRQGAALSKQEGDTVSEQEALKIIQDLEQSK